MCIRKLSGGEGGMGRGRKITEGERQKRGVAIQLFQHHLLKRILSPMNGLGTLVKKIN